MSQMEQAIMNELRPIDVSNIVETEEISTTEVMEGYRRWPEKTLTLPIGRHLGIYKVWLFESEKEKKYNEIRKNTPTENDDDQIPTMSDREFFDIITEVINLVLKLQHPLKRWQKVNVLMAPKALGGPKPARIRFLNQFDSEINLLRRIIIAQRAMINAEDSNTLTDLQWGVVRHVTQ